MKWDKRFLRIAFAFNCEVRLSKPSNPGSQDPHYIIRRAPMAVGYNIIIRFLTSVPPEPIENILEWVNHRFSSTVCVTEFEGSKPLLVRLSPVSRTGVSIE